MEIGPFVDGELHDPELDETLSFGDEFQGAAFEPRTLREAEALHRVLVRRRLRITPRVVRAMGLVRAGGHSTAVAIASYLERCDDEEFEIVTEGFLASHYPARLFASVRCSACNARNDVDAPYDREFDAARLESQDSRGDADAGVSRFPELAEFEARALAIADEFLPEAHGAITFVVEDGVPLCDEGGEPLLGSYLPPVVGDNATPTTGAEIAVYYRTFRAMWNDDGAYDWEDELRETIEHELAHHEANLRGTDPVDDEERREIALEEMRIKGRRTLVRRELSGFGDDLVSFAKRTWPLWLLVFALTVLATMFGDNGD